MDVPELLWLAPGAKEPDTLTDLNEDWHEKYALAPTELVTWRSPDGLAIEGLLTCPPDYEEGQTYPLIVVAARRAARADGAGAVPVHRVAGLCRRGLRRAVAQLPGQRGYGNAFSIANRDDLGGGDYQDVLAGIDWAIAEGIADPDGWPSSALPMAAI